MQSYLLGEGTGGGLINFLSLKRGGGLLEGGGLFERGSLIEDSQYIAGRLNSTNHYASPLILETKTETYQMLLWAVLFFVTLKVLT